MISDQELAQYRDNHYLRLVKELAAEVIESRAKIASQTEAIKHLTDTVNEPARENTTDRR